MLKAMTLVVMVTIGVGACGPRSTPTADLAPSGISAISPVLASASPPTAIASETPAEGAGMNAGTFPKSGAYSWNILASGFGSPVDIQFPTDGTERMFIVEQAGRIRIVTDGKLAGTSFLDISERVNSRGNEQGLLGLAFHPQYARNGLIFVNYTDYQQHNVIARFQVSTNPGLADATSETILISADDPFANHNGGALAFGPDGYLYAGLGDGGGANDVLGNAQNTNTLLGTILRLDVDSREPYAIPGDNPFQKSGGSPEIWAYGLRNPWRLSFDAATGDLYIGDVGQAAWEEINILAAGSPGGVNFGWNYREGTHGFSGIPPISSKLVDPIMEYSHNEGCAVTGGYVYRGRMTEWTGVYLYGDYCSGKVWGLLGKNSAEERTSKNVQLLFETGASITTFGQDPGGELYLAERTGAIYRLEPLP